MDCKLPVLNVMIKQKGLKRQKQRTDWEGLQNLE